jgi:hypothetical protein
MLDLVQQILNELSIDCVQVRDLISGRSYTHVCYSRGVRLVFLILGRQVQASILGIDEYGAYHVREESARSHIAIF